MRVYSKHKVGQHARNQRKKYYHRPCRKCSSFPTIPKFDITEQVRCITSNPMHPIRNSHHHAAPALQALSMVKKAK